MPHCDTCDRFYNPNSLKTDGSCPVCGRPVGEPREAKLTRFETEGAPWHFKLLVAATVLYLGWRFVQMTFWLFT